MYLKHVITAGILSAALAIGPGAAYAQSTGSTSGSSQGTASGSTSSPDTSSGTSGAQTTGSQTPSSQGSPSSTAGTASPDSSRQAGSSGADQDAVRQHLTSAREALAELTKLPAASQLQGDQRQKVAQFISEFNAFATATTDWRPKYDAVDRSLDELLGVDGSASMSGAATSPAPGASASAGTTAETAPGAGATVGTSGDAAAGNLDPTIVAKLREVRTHLDAFEDASGDPTFVVEKIEKILDQASSGAAGGGAVGTSGTTGASDGAVTLSASQVQEIRRQLDSIKAAAKR